MMLTSQQAQQLLSSAELIHSEQVITQTLQRLADEITQVLAQQQPLVLCVMGGAVVFAGQLLPQLRFPMDFDYLHLSRYGKGKSGGAIHWQAEPREDVRDRVVLVLDDILDEGHTMSAIKEKLLEMGAASCATAVFANKLIDKPKPIQADYVGIDVPNRYVFGYGMDAAGAWRNLGAVYALCPS